MTLTRHIHRWVFVLGMRMAAPHRGDARRDRALITTDVAGRVGFEGVRAVL